MEIEIWKDIAELKGQYQVSNLGRIKSLSRLALNNDGRKRMLKERVLATSAFKNVNSYIMTSIHKKMYNVHLLVWDAFSDKERGGNVVDHINENKLDPRFSNLQLLTHRDNITKHHVIKGRKFTGVSKKRNKWGAWIHDKKSVFLGSFETQELAHEAYLKAKMKVTA